MPLLDWLNRAETVKIADQIPYHLLQTVDDLSVSCGKKEARTRRLCSSWP